MTETKSSSGREGGRSLKTRVKTARKRKLSSTLWLERQLNDPYVERAKREGCRSRAAYKLIEIDERYHFLKPGQKVVDLGAAPGGWSQVAAGKVGSEQGKGRVIGIDLLDMEPLPGVEFKVMDFLSEDAPEQLMEWLGGKADDAQLIGFLMPGRIGRHVGKDDIGFAAEPFHEPLRRILAQKIHDLELDARQRLHVEKIDADDPSFALLRANLARRHLRPAAGRRAKIDDPLAGF